MKKKRRSPSARPRSKGEVARIVSIPDDVVLAPQAEGPRVALATDRSAAPHEVTELSWSDVERMVDALATEVRARARPTVVLGIAHGGVFVGEMLARALGCAFHAVRLTRRSRDPASAADSGLLGRLPSGLKGASVLLVDDIAASGDAFEVGRLHAERAGVKTIRTASLIRRGHGYATDFVASQTDEVLVFPWDYDPVARGFERTAPRSR